MIYNILYYISYSIYNIIYNMYEGLGFAGHPWREKNCLHNPWVSSFITSTIIAIRRLSNLNSSQHIMHNKIITFLKHLNTDDILECRTHVSSFSDGRYEPLLDSSNMSMEDWSRIATDIGRYPNLLYCWCASGIYIW